jgi:hypothetical protein
MKKAVLTWALIVTMLGASPAFAFLYDFPILTKEEIKALDEAGLINAYIDAKIELDASRTFHGKAGFTPKEYNHHKELLNLVIKLRLEMQLRELDVPPIDEWIR